MRLRNILIFFIFASGPVQAYEFGDGYIDIPGGFEGPITQNIGQGARSAAFTFPHANGGGALLQITAWDPGQTIPPMSAEELKKGSKQYLLQFLGGVERKRNNFKRREVQFVQISGHPAAKVAWSGEVQGKEVHGVMYCLIFNSKIYSLHTQDLASFGKKYTAMAVDAFESIQLER